MTTARPVSGSNERKVMSRLELTKRLVGKLKHDEAVIGGIGNTNFDLWATGQRPQNFYMFGSMGLACPIALGVALAQPARRVVALEGDGSLLMQLGVLAPIGMLKPRNLTVVVMDNGMYQITGAQPTASSYAADFVAIARGAGIAQSDWALDEASFEGLVGRALATDGPSFIAARIDAKRSDATTERDPAQIRDRFMRGIGAKK